MRDWLSRNWSYGYSILYLILVIGLILWGVAFFATLEQEAPLIFAELPADDATAVGDNWQPLMDHLSKELGRTVELKIVTDYTAVVEALKYGHADIARLGPSGYVLAEQEVDLISIASVANDDGSLMAYQSYIIALPGLNTLEGATLAYVDIGSTSGYLVPATYIKKQGIQLGKTVFAGSHPAVIEAVKNGSVDAGATCDTRWLSAIEQGVIEADELIILWQSDPMPRGAVVVRAGLPEDLRLAIQAAFLNAPPEIVEQCNLQSSRFGPAPPDVYEPFREIQKYIGLVD